MGDPKHKKDGAKTGKAAIENSNVDISETNNLVKEALSKLDVLKNTVDKISKESVENFKSSQFSQGVIQDKLEEFSKEFERLRGEIDSLKKSNAKLQANVTDLTSKINQYDLQAESRCRDEKRANLCLDGIKEDIDCDLEHVVNDLFKDLSLDFEVRDVCQSIYRKGGHVNSGEMKTKPRPVIIKFYEPFQKKMIFQNLKNLAGNPKWKNVFINDDLTQEQAGKMKDLRAINGYARSIGKDSKIKGMKIIIEGKSFGLDDVDKVPQEISIVNAKNIEIMDGKGIAFQGHHSFMSNMSTSEFEFKGKQFKSVEVGYQYMRACANDCHDDASKIRKEGDAYAAKRANKKIKDNEKWNNSKEKIMKDLVSAKFNQNEELKQKLISTGDKKLFECTEDRFWGCNVLISKAKELNPNKMQGKNILGKILMEVRGKISKK